MKKTHIAKLLDVHPNTVTRMLEDGRLEDASLRSVADYLKAEAYQEGRRELLAEFNQYVSDRPPPTLPRRTLPRRSKKKPGEK